MLNRLLSLRSARCTTRPFQAPVARPQLANVVSYATQHRPRTSSLAQAAAQAVVEIVAAPEVPAMMQYSDLDAEELADEQYETPQRVLRTKRRANRLRDMQQTFLKPQNLKVEWEIPRIEHEEERAFLWFGLQEPLLAEVHEAEQLLRQLQREEREATAELKQLKEQQATLQAQHGTKAKRIITAPHHDKATAAPKPAVQTAAEQAAPVQTVQDVVLQDKPSAASAQPPVPCHLPLIRRMPEAAEAPATSCHPNPSVSSSGSKSSSNDSSASCNDTKELVLPSWLGQFLRCSIERAADIKTLAQFTSQARERVASLTAECAAVRQHITELETQEQNEVLRVMQPSLPAPVMFARCLAVQTGWGSPTPTTPKTRRELSSARMAYVLACTQEALDGFVCG